MHTDCLQIRDLKYDTDELNVSEVEDILIENNYVDYVQPYKDTELKIREWLDFLTECGCEVDKQNHTFKIVDREAFCEFCMKGLDVYYKGDYNLITWTDKAKFLEAGNQALYFEHPTVCDGCAYGSLLEAVMYSMFGSFGREEKEYVPDTFELLGVYDCHN